MPESSDPESITSPNEDEEIPHQTKGTFRGAVLTIYRVDGYDEIPSDKLAYFAYGNETCPTTGRPHLQAFSYAKQPLRFAAWKALFPTAHILKMRGTFTQNQRYCSKEGQLIEYGVRPMENGKKRTVAEVVQAIEQGESYKKLRRQPEITETCARFNRFFKEIEQDVRLERSRAAGFQKKTISVYIGAAGCFKSRHVREQFPDVYSMPDNSMQWAGSYDGQSAVLFDDVGPGNIMSITNFLRYCDGYPIEAPIKGGFVPWTPEHIFFTSNTHPRAWWKDIDPLQLEAVERRLDVIRVYKAPGDYEEYGPGQT